MFFFDRVPEIEPAELIAEAGRGEPLQVLDIRAPQTAAAGAIELPPPATYLNLPGSRLAALRDPSEIGLDRAKPVAVVCAMGNSSRQVTTWLNRLGYRARSVAGGMARWAITVVAREIAPPAGFDRLIQFDRVANGALGYAVLAGGEALLVDVPRDPGPFLDAVAAAGARVKAVADTHCHADYFSGGPALARELDVPYHLHPDDAVDPYEGRPAKIPFTPLADGQTLALGGARIGVVHTPGHTAGSVCFRLGDGAALTGDFLFVASIGRPDLAGRCAEWTGLLWRSVGRARAEWGDGLLVLPAHYASARERRADHAVAAPFGELKRGNPGLAHGDEASFAAWVAARCTSFPEAYRRIKTANLGLERIDEWEARELETGKNQCALAG